MVAGATVLERIIDDVMTVLAAITAGATFNKTMAFTRRQSYDPKTVQDWPAAIVIHQGMAAGGSGGEGEFQGVVTRHLRLLVYGCVLANQDPDWPQELNLLAGDIEIALRADHQRGGLAHWTQIEDARVFDQSELGGVGVAAVEIPVLIKFRHMLNDLTTAV